MNKFFDTKELFVFQGKRCKICRQDFHHQCAEHLSSNCPGEDCRSSSLMRRTSSSIAIHSNTSTNHVFADSDMINMSNDNPKVKTQKKPGFFTGSGRNARTAKNSSGNAKNQPPSSVNTSTSSTPSIKTITTTIESDQNEVVQTNNANENVLNSSTTSTAVTATVRKNVRMSGTDGSLQVTPRLATVNGKQDRRKDIKITNCQEKDGIWVATGQFGRESRQSKRADITYDKKKFRFIQKDDQGNKHVFEIPVADVEGRSSDMK